MARDPILDKVHISLDDESLVRRGDKVLISMSAGKDSVALFHIMRALSVEMGLTLGVFHFNHGTRDKDSDDDEYFVRDLCADYGYPFHSTKESFNTAEASFEKRARDRRYALLNEIAERDNYDRIMTAHTKSDQAETVLMRIFTGTHISGLCSIPAVRGRIVRPLLDCSSAEIVQYLERNGLRWREDRSNADIRYARNFIRHEILPLIESRFPRSRDTISGIAEAAKENTYLIEEMADMCGIMFRVTSSVSELDFGRRNVSRILFNWGAARLFSSRNMYVSRERLDEAWKKYRTESCYSILYEEGGSILEKDSRDGTLVLRMRNRADMTIRSDIDGIISVTKDGSMLQTFVMSGFSFSIARIEYDDFLRQRNDPGKLFMRIDDDESMECRIFTPGDRMLVNGSYKKVKYLMNDNKCSPDEKRMIPIIMVGRKIAAIPFSMFNRGFDRIADDRLVDSGSKKILAICYTRIENER